MLKDLFRVKLHEAIIKTNLKVLKLREDVEVPPMDTLAAKELDPDKVNSFNRKTEQTDHIKFFAFLQDSKMMGLSAKWQRDQAKIAAAQRRAMMPILPDGKKSKLFI